MSFTFWRLAGAPINRGHQLLGQQWALWFGDGGAEPSTVLPRQAVCMLHQALDRFKSSYEKLAESRAVAASSYAVLTESHKKRRTEVP